MKKTFLLLIVIFLLIFKSYSQTKIDSIKIELEAKILNLQDSISKLKQDESSLYSLKKDLLANRKDMISLKIKNDENHKEWWSDFFKFYGILGLIIGGGIGFYGVKLKTQQIAIEKIAAITGIDQKELKQILDNKLTNKKLRTDNSFFILNQNKSVFTPGFMKVMNLFGIDAKNDDVLANIDGLNNIDNTLIKKIKKHNVLIIENQAIEDNSRWELPKFFENFESLKNKIKELEEEENRDEKQLKALKNYKNLVDLSNKICDTTSIIYYGQAGVGNFPSDLVNSDLQHKITFANAPAQLYGNINNQLQFIYELDKKVNIFL